MTEFLTCYPGKGLQETAADVSLAFSCMMAGEAAVAWLRVLHMSSRHAHVLESSVHLLPQDSSLSDLGSFVTEFLNVILDLPARGKASFVAHLHPGTSYL